MPGTGASVGGTVTSFAEVWIEMMLKTPGWKWNIVTSFAEVWIEILDNFYKMRVDRVTSFAEVWIEIRKTLAR